MISDRTLDDGVWFAFHADRKFRLRSRNPELGEWPPLPPSREGESYRTLVIKISEDLQLRLPIPVEIGIENSEPTESDLFSWFDGTASLQMRMKIAALRETLKAA